MMNISGFVYIGIFAFAVLVVLWRVYLRRVHSKTMNELSKKVLAELAAKHDPPDTPR